MDKNILGTNVVTQVGIIVHDIEKASQDFADFFGVEKPEWSLSGPLEQAQTEYMGETSEARAKLAFFYAGGSLAFELIEPDQNPSTWRHDLDTYGECVHHLAFNINGTKEKTILLQKNGMNLIQKGEYEGGRYSYFDTKDILKFTLELLEND